MKFSPCDTSHLERSQLKTPEFLNISLKSLPRETKLNVLKWTMQQLRKHDVSGSLGFDKGYEQGYNDATREACKEIAKNYQPNDR